MGEKEPKKGQKIGIDTSVIVQLIVKDINIRRFKEKEFSENDLLYYTLRTKYEFKGVILNKYGFDKKEKNKLWRRAKNLLGLTPLRIGRRNISQYINKVKTANDILVEQNSSPKFQISYKIGKADIEIISNFLKSGITKVYTSDRAFYDTCKILGLKSKLISLQDYANMKKL